MGPVVGALWQRAGLGIIDPCRHRLQLVRQCTPRPTVVRQCIPLCSTAAILRKPPESQPLTQTGAHIRAAPATPARALWLAARPSRRRVSTASPSSSVLLVMPVSVCTSTSQQTNVLQCTVLNRGRVPKLHLGVSEFFCTDRRQVACGLCEPRLGGSYREVRIPV